MLPEMRVVAAGERDAYWSEGTRSEIILSAADTGGALSVLAEVLPPGQGPPLHSHPQDETFLVLAGSLTIWSVPVEDLSDAEDPWNAGLSARGVRCDAGRRIRVPGGRAHCYRVDGDRPAEIVVLSHPSGLEEWTRAFGVVASGPGLPPAGFEAPQPERDQARAFARSVGVRRHGPPAPLPPAAHFGSSDAQFGSSDAQFGSPATAGLPAMLEPIEALPLRAGVSHGLRSSTDAVYLVAEGRADIVVGGERHPLDQGGCVRVPAGAKQVWTAHAGAVVLVLD